MANTKKKIEHDWIATAGLIAFLLWCIWWVVPAEHEMKANEAGDSFGSLNALFTAAAFLGLLYQIKLQREELAETRKDVRLQTEALKVQAEVMREQVLEARGQAEATRTMIDQAKADALAQHAVRVIQAVAEYEDSALEALHAIESNSEEALDLLHAFSDRLGHLTAMLGLHAGMPMYSDMVSIQFDRDLEKRERLAHEMRNQVIEWSVDTIGAWRDCLPQMPPATASSSTSAS